MVALMIVRYVLLFYMDFLYMFQVRSREKDFLLALKIQMTLHLQRVKYLGSVLK